MLSVNMRQLHAALLSCVAASIPAMVWGSPGIGKSQLVKQISEEIDEELREKNKTDECQFGFVDFRTNLRDPVDLRGLPLVDAKMGTTRWLPPMELPDTRRNGKRGIFLADELPQASMAMQTAMFGLILEGRLGEYVMPKGWARIAAGNLRSDRSGAQMMPVALRNRFAHFQVSADVDSWVRWAAKAQVHPMVISFLRFRPALIYKMAEGDENSFPTPRSWEAVGKIAGTQDKTLRKDLAISLIGSAAAAEFEAFFRVWDQLPDIDQIFKEPTRAKVPDKGDVGTLYAVASALGQRINKNNIGAAFEYAKRLPTEFEIIVAVDTVRRDKELRSTKPFTEWFIRNSKVLI